MKRFFALHASLTAVLLLLAAAPALSQVHVGIGVRIGPPPPRYEVVGMPPYAHAHWIRGHWSWDDWSRDYVWVPGHWLAMRPAPVVVEERWRHVPKGKAWGYWRKHGENQEYYSRDDRRESQDVYRDNDRDEHRDDDRGNRGNNRGGR